MIVRLGLILLLTSMSGCSLFVMAGKALMGDPQMPSAFKIATGVDLTKADKKVMLLCSMPEFVISEHSAVDRDIIDQVYRRMKLQRIQCVNPDKVDSWLNQNGGMFEHPSELVNEIDTDYIVHYELQSVTFREPDSPTFYRGNANVRITVYEVNGEDSSRQAFEIFQHEITSTYPRNFPMAADTMSERSFRDKYIGRLSNELAQLFYTYNLGDGLD